MTFNRNFTSVLHLVVCGALWWSSDFIRVSRKAQLYNRQHCRLRSVWLERACACDPLGAPDTSAVSTVIQSLLWLMPLTDTHSCWGAFNLVYGERETERDITNVTIMRPRQNETVLTFIWSGLVQDHVCYGVRESDLPELECYSQHNWLSSITKCIMHHTQLKFSRNSGVEVVDGHMDAKRWHLSLLYGLQVYLWFVVETFR